MLIVPLLLEAIKDRIVDQCITAMPDGPCGEPNPYKLSKVKVGRFYEDPTSAPYRIAVLHGDLEDSSYPDSIFKRATHQRTIAMNYPSREIGGGQVWLRRGTVRMEFYIFAGDSEDEAREKAYTMANNVLEAVESMAVAGIKTTLESAHEIFVVSTEMLQTGGPPASWIYRGKLYWEVQTERRV